MAADAREETKTRTHQRKAQVRAAMERIIWTECESDDAEALVDSLDDLLSESALYDGFAEGEVEAHIAHIREALGLSAEIIPLKGADPPPQGEVAEGRRGFHPQPPPRVPPQSLRDSSP